jgi:cytochrome c-type biogenesis protein CcmH
VPEQKFEKNKEVFVSATEQTSKIPRVLLYAALLVLALAIGIGVWRNYSPAEPAISRPNAAAGQGAGSASAVAALEARTAKDPSDVEGWQLLGWSYFESGRYSDAVASYRKATALEPDRAVYWSSLGESLVMASDQDPMPKDAASAFERAIKLDPTDPRARYFMAVRRDLAGDHDGAVGEWLALLKDTPKDAPWESDLIRTIEQVGQINKLDVAPKIAAAVKDRKLGVSLPASIASAAPRSVAAAPIPGPTRADMAAAANLPSGQQQAMVQAMVDGLEAKLEKNPANVNGWIMLMRSRITLGETVKAKTALNKAIESNPGAKDKLRQEAQILGVPGA